MLSVLDKQTSPHHRDLSSIFMLKEIEAELERSKLRLEEEKTKEKIRFEIENQKLKIEMEKHANLERAKLELEAEKKRKEIELFKLQLRKQAVGHVFNLKFLHKEDTRERKNLEIKNQAMTKMLGENFGPLDFSYAVADIPISSDMTKSTTAENI